MTTIDDILSDYRPNVAVALFNKRGEVWIGRRVPEPHGVFPDEYRWQMPQGGIDAGEEPVTAAARELREETGVVSARLLTITPGWLPYDFPSELREKLTNEHWQGQRQKWAAMLFEGDDSEIDLLADQHQEFDDWRWCDLEDTPDLIIPFKRQVYEEMVASFRPLRDFLRSTRLS